MGHDDWLPICNSEQIEAGHGCVYLKTKEKCTHYAADHMLDSEPHLI